MNYVLFISIVIIRISAIKMNLKLLNMHEGLFYDDKALCKNSRLDQIVIGTQLEEQLLGFVA